MASELLVKDAKKLLALFFWIAFFFWMVLWILLPTTSGEAVVARAKQRSPSFVGDFGATLIVYSAPVIVFSIASLLVLHLKSAYPEIRSSTSRTKAESKERGSWKRIQNLMWTQPLVTSGPLGVATGFDIAAVTVVLALVAWIFFKTLIPELRLISAIPEAPPPGPSQKYQMRMGQSASAFARAALLPMTLLCFPVSRGSPMLRMIGIPFQHAVKYHRWLGHLTLTLYSAHSVLFTCVFVTEHDALKLLKWPLTGISYASGTVAFAAGLVMWLTAVAPIRRRWFGLFYVTHHLYLVFFTFLVFHVGPKVSAYTAGGLFLFFVDRFIRMVQSRHGLSLAATKVYPSGVMELKLRKSPGVAYSALSVVFVKIPCVSRLQWHPFSVTSSPLDNSPTLTICIKPLGEWTKKLHRTLVASDSKATTPGCSFSNLLFAEGPYSYASECFLKYDALLLVAGGIGITPFVAILRDLFYRYQAKECGLPKSIQLIWTVKRGSELVLLTDIFPAKRFSNATIHFECHAFLTGHDNRYDTGEVSLLHGKYDSKHEMTTNFPNVSGHEGSVSPVSATGNGLWIASLIAVGSCATVLLSTYVLDRSTTLQSPSGEPISSQHIALLYIGSTVLGISGFGGVVMILWSMFRNMNSWENFKKTSVYDEEGAPASFPLPDRENVWQRNALDNTHVMRGRPNIPKYFNAAAECYRGKDVGVLVCGPESLKQSVAAECKAHYKSSSVSPFYFHSVSFDM